MRLFKILGLIFALSIFFSTLTSAAPIFMDKPDMLSPQHISGAFFWKDSDNVYHICVTTLGDTHTLTGTIKTDGYFGKIKETAAVDKTTKDDVFTIKDRDTMKINLTSTGPETGLTFKVSNGRKINFDLQWDNTNISSSNIYIGKSGWHPDTGKFSIDILDFNLHMGDTHSDQPLQTVIVRSSWDPSLPWPHRMPTGPDFFEP